MSCRSAGRPPRDSTTPLHNARSLARLVAVASLTILVASCSFFSRSKSRVFALERIPPTGPVATVRGAPVGIDVVDLPPGFDRREVVVRQAGQGLEVRSGDLWSASLQPAVLHTLAFDLAGRLPEGMVILPGASKPVGPMRSIDVMVEELAAGPGPRVVLDARWVLRESGRANVTRHERIGIDLATLDSAQIASGMSRALATLADRIVAGLNVINGA